MKVFIVLAALVAVVLANANDETLRFDTDVGVEGYKFAYETSGGIKHEETGVLNNVGSENEAISVKGSYSYVGDDGVTYTVNFLADENGFQPQGVHLPKSE